MISYSIKGFYGSGKTKCTVYVYENHNGSSWYVVHGSVNVNRTMQEVKNGINVEELSDYQTFTASRPIKSLKELIKQVES